MSKQWTPDEWQIIIDGYTAGDTPEVIAMRIPWRSPSMVKYQANLMCLIPKPPRTSRTPKEVFAKYRDQGFRKVPIEQITNPRKGDAYFRARMRDAIKCGAEQATPGVSTDPSPTSARMVHVTGYVAGASNLEG